jgi:putative NADH-flavin reductase
MKVAVFGATRGVGRAVVDQALACGHAVTALARDPAKLAVAHPNLAVVHGDVLDPAAVAQVVGSADAVFVSLGSTSGNPDDVVSRGTQNVVAAMQAVGVRRLIVVTSLGVGDSRN